MYLWSYIFSPVETDQSRQEARNLLMCLDVKNLSVWELTQWIMSVRFFFSPQDLTGAWFTKLKMKPTKISWKKTSCPHLSHCPLFELFFSLGGEVCTLGVSKMPQLAVFTLGIPGHVEVLILYWHSFERCVSLRTAQIERSGFTNSWCLHDPYV